MRRLFALLDLSFGRLMVLHRRRRRCRGRSGRRLGRVDALSERRQGQENGGQQYQAEHGHFPAGWEINAAHRKALPHGPLNGTEYTTKSDSVPGLRRVRPAFEM